jgi:hypothetical protein
LAPDEVRRSFASFSYLAQSWNEPRRVVAKVEWHPGELYPPVGFIVTNLARPAERELTGLREKLVKIGARVISHGRYVTFQLAEVAVSRQMFQGILTLIAAAAAAHATV